MMQRSDMGGPEEATLGAIGFMREQAGAPGVQAPVAQTPAAGLSLGGQDAGGLGAGGALAGIEQVREGYDSLVQSILGGNRSAGDSITQLFSSLTGGGKQAKQALAGVFEGMAGQIFSGMADYAKQLGVLTGLASTAFTALKSMNPFAAAAASIGLIALGAALKSLAGSLGKGGGYQNANTGGGYSQAASASASTVASASQPLSIYIGGLGSGVSSYEVERTLDRAGVDRELRERFRELVRTGANPALGY
ncbi:hypothetical protein LLH00_12215 [bacterium]|nr:hypothetical protein [bacterium]